MAKSIFEDDFLWGASISSHQVEGGNDNDWTDWEQQNAVHLAKSASSKFGYLPDWPKLKKIVEDPKNYISGSAVDHKKYYKKDFELLKKLNLNTLRFSIEWSRIEPEEGKFSKAGLRYYKTYLNELKRQGITPVVTLWHFTLPKWFAAKGGFEKRANLKDFERYVGVIAKAFGKDFKYALTMNEPMVYAYVGYKEGKFPPQKESYFYASRVVLNLTSAHKKAAKILLKFNQDLKIGVAHNMVDFYRGDESRSTKLNLKILHYLNNNFFLSRTKRHLDFIGVNYYFAERHYGFGLGSDNPDKNRNDLGWDMQPARIENVINRVWEKYKLPILITENGLADGKDKYRKWWLAETLKAMIKLKRSGVGLFGYCHWSLLDNFEWAEGFWPKFGLIAVDRKTQARKIRPSAKWWADILLRIQNPGPRTKPVSTIKEVERLR